MNWILDYDYFTNIRKITSYKTAINKRAIKIEMKKRQFIDVRK